MSPNRRILLNIIATYGRSLYALALGLFTARWALQALGQVDFGLYGVIGGLTAFVAFISNLMATAIGRFYAVSVGHALADQEHGLEVCQQWFSTAVLIHSLIPLILVMIGYPIGAWAVRSFLTIPPERIQDCIFVWRFACMSCVVGMVCVPFQAMYTAKQEIAELTIYSFVTTTLNACFLYYIVTHPGLWLRWYALWMSLMAIGPALVIAVRATMIFPECRFRLAYAWSRSRLVEVMNYAGWQAFGGLGAMLRAQGIAVLVNKYFGPKANAALTVGTQLSNHCNTLSSSLTGAFAPAIMNAYGAGQYERMRCMAYRTCKIGTLCILVFAVPLILEIDEVLFLWLKNPPRYAAGLCICVLVMNIIDKTAMGHMLAVNARGKIAAYQSFLGGALILTLPLGWLMLALGMSIYAVGWAMIITMMLCAWGRVWFARTLVGMSARYWLKSIMTPIIGLTLMAFAVGSVPRYLCEASFWRVVWTTLVVEACLLPLSWFVLLDSSERGFLRAKFFGLLQKWK